MYDPSFLRRPVVSVFELSDPAKSIKFWKNEAKPRVKPFIDELYLNMFNTRAPD